MGKSPTTAATQSPTDWKFLGSFLGCCCLLAALIALSPWVAYSFDFSQLSYVLMAIHTGSLWATPVIFSFYLNFAVTVWWKRWCIALAAAASLWLVLVATCLFESGGSFFGEVADVISAINAKTDLNEGRFIESYVVHLFLSVSFSAPSFLLIAMAPTWLCGVFFSWRLRSSNDNRPSPKLSIGSLLAVTAFVATAVAGLRATLWLNAMDAPLDQLIASVLIPHLVIMFVATVMQVVGLWTLLRIRNMLFACGLAAIPLLLAPLAAALTAMSLAFNAADQLVTMSFALAGFFFVGYLHLFLLRWAGYRIFAGNPLPNSDSSLENNE